MTEETPTSGPRWLVILVRPPAETVPDTGAPMSGARLFPILLLATTKEEEAAALAARLRDEGATVTVMDERIEAPATCSRHPPQLLGRTCSVCGQGVCAQCRVEAGGDRLCPVCARRKQQRQRRRRVADLFALFLFSVFAYEAVNWYRDEQAHLDPAKGISVAVFQFVAPGAADHPMVRALNDVDGPYALSRVKDWYDTEYRRYTSSDAPLIRIQIYGPWVTEVSPPTLDAPDAGWAEVAWTSWSYTRYWHSLARKFGAEPDEWDARVYLIYADEAGDLASESRGSSKGRIAVSYVSLSDPNPAYAQLTVAHELGHIMGAEDLYDESTFLAQIPLGLPEPNRLPTFPQRYAEVMAGDRALTPTSEQEISSLTQARVGYHSAALMGWIDPAQAELHYLPRKDVKFGPEEAPPARSTPTTMPAPPPALPEAAP